MKPWLKLIQSHFPSILLRLDVYQIHSGALINAGGQALALLQGAWASVFPVSSSDDSDTLQILGSTFRAFVLNPH